MAGRAVGLAAPRVDRMGEEVVAGMKVERPDGALVARDALAAVMARGAGGADLARLLGVVILEAGAVRVAQAVVRGDERAVLEAGLDQTAELGEVTVGAVALLGAVAVASQARQIGRASCRE